MQDIAGAFRFHTKHTLVSLSFVWHNEMLLLNRTLTKLLKYGDYLFNEASEQPRIDSKSVDGAVA